MQRLQVETYCVFKTRKGVWCGGNGVSKADRVWSSDRIREHQVTLHLVGTNEESGFYSEHKEVGSCSEHDEEPWDDFT